MDNPFVTRYGYDRTIDHRSFTQYTMPKDLRSLRNLHSGRLRKLPILI